MAIKTRHCLLAAVTLVLTACAAVAPQLADKVSCTNTSPGPEPMSDGRALSVSSATCKTEGGPMNGGIATQHAMWELDNGKLVLLSGDGVVRKPGSLLTYKLTSGTTTFVMKDGRPVGWTGSGTGVYTTGSGDAAVLKGKTFSWTGRATGPNTHVIESKLD